MNLKQIRDEVLARGFDSVQYGSRITQFINDAMTTIATEVDYFQNEAISQFPTVSGTDTYAWPASLAEIRSLFDTDRRIVLQYASLTDMDASPNTSGAPAWYAISGQNVRLYPVPDAVYNLEMRYWQLPATLVADTDVPALPAERHKLLWTYATWMCYEADDDAQMGQYWEGRWNRELSAMKADVKFPSSDGPRVASGMWDQDDGLSSGGWSLWGY